MENIKKDEGLSIILAFTSGILLSKFSLGFLFFILFLLFIELSYAIYTKMEYPWSPEIRILVILFGLFGFILGRVTLKDKNIFRMAYCNNEFTRPFYKEL